MWILYDKFQSAPGPVCDENVTFVTENGSKEDIRRGAFDTFIIVRPILILLWELVEI